MLNYTYFFEGTSVLNAPNSHGMIDDNLLNIYDEVFDSYHELTQGTIKLHMDKFMELDQILPPSLSFFIITNTTLNQFPFVSKNFEANLGLDPKLMSSVGAPYWLSHFHPDDLPIWVNMLGDLMTYTMTHIAPDKRMNLSYTWNFRLRTSNSNYVNLFEHQSPLLLDSSGKPIVGVGHLTIIGEDSPMPIKASIKSLNEQNEYETVYVKNYSQLALSDELTNRENDIIRLLAMKKTSKEIGTALHISSHTVDTHRRNILKKLSLSSTGELIAYAKTQQIY